MRIERKQTKQQRVRIEDMAAGQTFLSDFDNQVVWVKTSKSDLLSSNDASGPFKTLYLVVCLLDGSNCWMSGDAERTPFNGTLVEE